MLKPAREQPERFVRDAEQPAITARHRDGAPLPGWRSYCGSSLLRASAASLLLRRLGLALSVDVLPLGALVGLNVFELPLRITDRVQLLPGAAAMRRPLGRHRPFPSVHRQGYHPGGNAKA